MKKLLIVISTLQGTVFLANAQEGHPVDGYLANSPQAAPSESVRSSDNTAINSNIRKFSDDEIRKGGIELAELLKDPDRVNQMKNLLSNEPFRNALKTQGEFPVFSTSMGAGSGAMAGIGVIVIYASFFSENKLLGGYPGFIGILGSGAISGASSLYNTDTYKPGIKRQQLLDSMAPTQLEHDVRSYFYLWGPSAGMNAERREAASQRVISLLELSRGKVLTSSQLQDIFNRALQGDEKDRLLKAQEKFWEILPKSPKELSQADEANERAKKAALIFMLHQQLINR